MTTEIKNGERYDAIKENLAERKDIVVLGESTVSRFDNKKLRGYEDTHIVVAPKESIEPEELYAFTQGLLSIEPVSRHEAGQGRLRAFDTLGKNWFRPITIEVFTGTATSEGSEK